MSEDSNESENKGPCVCGCYAFEHKDSRGECNGKHFTANGSREDCDCKGFIPAKIMGGWGARNRQQDMIESCGKMRMHASMMVFDGSPTNEKIFTDLMNDFDALRTKIAEMTFVYRAE